MILAADLDRTLIFSPRTLTEPDGVIPVEYRQGTPDGFMTPDALRTLRLLAVRTGLFVNTLRGLEQARRVAFVADGTPRYLALQNGLYLYHGDREDPVWAVHVRRTVSALPLGLTDGIARVLSGLPGIECLSKRYEYLAVFFVDAHRFDDAACAQLASELADLGWALCRQRRKLYLSPLAVDKGTVLARVMELEGAPACMGFGDSWFDLPMLRTCTRAYSLRGCELDGADWGFPIHFSRSSGAAGTEEILRLLAGASGT